MKYIAPENFHMDSDDDDDDDDDDDEDDDCVLQHSDRYTKCDA
jgi:hypothetical protein